MSRREINIKGVPFWLFVVIPWVIGVFFLVVAMVAGAVGLVSDVVG